MRDETGLKWRAECGGVFTLILLRVTTRSLSLQCQQQGAQSTQWVISVRFCRLCFHAYKNSLIDQIILKLT